MLLSYSPHNCVQACGAQVICKFMMDYLGFESMQSAKVLRDEYFQLRGARCG